MSVDAVPATTGRRRRPVDLTSPASRGWLAAGALVVIVHLLDASYWSTGSAQAFGRQASILGVLAIGQTIVLLSGGIDLSVAGIVRFTSVVGAIVIDGEPSNVWIGIVTILSLGLVIGAVNGVIIAVGRASPFIVTLGMSLTLDALTLSVTRTSAGSASSTVTGFYDRTLFGIPWPTVVMLLLAGLAVAVLKRTVWGRSVYAIGGSGRLARDAGIRVVTTSLSAYAVSGVLAAAAAILLLSRSGVGDPLAAGGFELQAITACVIGGVSLAGGRGTVLGALGGVAFLTAVTTALRTLDIESRYQVLAQGVIVVLALATYRSRKETANHG